MVSLADVDTASEAIQALFVAQCAHGRQSMELAGLDAAACGQYLRYSSSSQRGLHGTASALLVLARGNTPETRGLSTRILRYLTDRADIERQAPGHKPDRDARITADSFNVIKLSEVLYALSFVQSAIGSRDALVQRIAQRLVDACQEDKGWSYFIGDGEPAELLPTAFAARALATHGYTVDSQTRFMMEELDRPTARQSDVFIQTVGIFVLTFLPNVSGVPREQLRRLLTRVWRTLERVLDEDLEANIEYSRGDRNYYIRVPWQLYLVAASARLRPYRIYASLRIQRRFKAILRAASGPSGFYYPHSGDRISSRTNGILFDVIKLIRPDVSRNTALQLAGSATDRVRIALGSRAVAFIGFSFAALMALYSIALWITNPNSSASDLGPNLVSAFVIVLLAFRKRL